MPRHAAGSQRPGHTRPLRPAVLLHSQAVASRGAQLCWHFLWVPARLVPRALLVMPGGTGPAGDCVPAIILAWAATRRAGAATCIRPTGSRRGSRHGRASTPSRPSCRPGSRPTRGCCILPRPRTTGIAWSAGPMWPRGAGCRCGRTRSSIRSRCRRRPPAGRLRTAARARRRADSTCRTPKSSPRSCVTGQPRRRTAGSACGTASAGAPLARPPSSPR